MSHINTSHVNNGPSIGHRQKHVTPVSAVTSFFELSSAQGCNKIESFSKYECRVILVVNIATGDPDTRAELIKLNDLIPLYEKYGFTVLCFPCNQFSQTEPFENDEIPLILRHVRPGGSFEPRFRLFSKCCVNGAVAHPVFEYLKLKLPVPVNDDIALVKDFKSISWSPVTRADIGGNYEKFLMTYEGQPVKRYTRRCPMERIVKDIEFYLRKIPRLVREEYALEAIPKGIHLQL